MTQVKVTKRDKHLRKNKLGNLSKGTWFFNNDGILSQLIKDYTKWYQIIPHDGILNEIDPDEEVTPVDEIEIYYA